MKKNNLKSSIRKFTPQKKRAVAEVISSLLLVVITVVGAVILTTFLDESFVAGGLSVTAGTDSSLKTIKLTAFDTRDGIELLGYAGINNDDLFPIDHHLCRDASLAIGCFTTANTDPINGGTGFMVIQIENRGINPIFNCTLMVLLSGISGLTESSFTTKFTV